MPNIELHRPGIEPRPILIECGRSTIELWNLYIMWVCCARDNLRGQKSLGPLKMSLEMAHKVIVPPKKNYIPQFLKQRGINSYYACRIGMGIWIQHIFESHF
jgi:hypothetical protein